MLDRYGISYVCSHPGILFASLAPPYMALTEIVSAANRGPSLPDSRDTYHGLLARRIAEAHRILQDFYAPCGSRR